MKNLENQMSCCGRARQSAAAPPPRNHGFAAAAHPPIFEYIGATSLTAVGAATGQRYHFAHGGARREVDPRDQASLARVPKLRRLTDR
jgi:uncharacterized protein (DUF2126 family)